LEGRGLEQILGKENGANFYKCDLHIHTPKSKCYKEPHIKPEDIIEKSLESGLGIIAITDHNTDGSFLEIQEASIGKDLLVLPGVEITTPQGGSGQIHMLAIFNNSDYRKVDELLTKIGIPFKKRSHSDAVANKTIPEIMAIVHELSGISLLSHVDLKGGIDVEMPTQTPAKQEILSCPFLKGIELTDMNNLSNYGNYACIQNSDAHSLDDIGKRYTLIKMGTPSFEGLRQALGDHESRIRLVDEKPPCHSHIIGIEFEGGFLDKQVIHFNNSLNCLIGGKGTGKSTIIELIRFALDSLSKDEEIKENEEKQIKDVMDYGKVKVVIDTSSGDRYLIDRTYDEEPRIFRSNGEEIGIDIKRFKEEFFKVDAYSQTELLEIARSFKNQLKMIDEYINLENLKSERDTIIRNLSINESSIIENESAIIELRSKVDEIQTVNEKLRVLDERGIKDKLRDHISWDHEERIFCGIKSDLEMIIKRWEEIRKEAESAKPILPSSDELENFPDKKTIKRIITQLNKSKGKLKLEIDGIIAGLNKDLEAFEEIYKIWQNGYGAKKEELRESLAELEAAGTPIKDYKDYLSLEREKKDLEESGKKIDQLNSILSDLRIKRGDKLRALRDNRNNIYKLRYELVTKINSAFEGFVRIKIEKERDVSSYSDYLVNDILSSQTYRIAKADREKIAQMVHPMRFAELIEKNDIESLAKEVNIKEEIAEKAIAMGSDKLYKMQTINLEDKITIELNDHGWKQISSCSDGQKCTAILSIAMFERNIPLIIDQPEDSLDNSFIYQEVVKIIRKIKNERQLIIATHNANIPVLGDSELILVMASNGKNGFVTERGVIDKDKIKIHVQNILEGGKEAFSRRKIKYGI
jgi:ABC-type cobalamin/Fe3+-siderophores transport system ATPase subunit